MIFAGNLIKGNANSLQIMYISPVLVSAVSALSRVLQLKLLKNPSTESTLPITVDVRCKIITPCLHAQYLYPVPSPPPPLLVFLPIIIPPNFPLTSHSHHSRVLFHTRLILYITLLLPGQLQTGDKVWSQNQDLEVLSSQAPFFVLSFYGCR